MDGWMLTLGSLLLKLDIVYFLIHQYRPYCQLFQIIALGIFIKKYHDAHIYYSPPARQTNTQALT